MNITSQAFDDGESIPPKYTCDGKDLSPPLSISDVPSKAISIALVFDDPDAPGSVFDHWIVWNIPPETTSIPENIPPKGELDAPEEAIQGKNDFGEIGYRGPCPPGGPPHGYRFKLYALDIEVDLQPGMLKKDLEREMEGHIIAEDELVGNYRR